MTYIYELDRWPAFRWSHEQLASRLAAVRHHQGRLIGRMEVLGFDLRAEANLQTLTEEVVKSSEIEGEILDKEQVRSSIARRLGLDVGGLVRTDRHVDGVVEMMIDATGKYDEPLTAERLFAWHAALFPTARNGMKKITVGKWRTEASGLMQVVSGPIGSERVHFEAPSADRVADEISTFLEWFESPPSTVDPVFTAAVAHLWFVTIHPFEDGNGRIARAIADLALSRAERLAQRFYSLSAQIRLERGSYYDALEAAQEGSLDITAWLEWFLGCLNRAIDGAEMILASVLKKARFWDRYRREDLNERQRTIINRLLNGFEGNLTSSKWAKLAKCSQDTALRDINDLLERGIFVKNTSGGRSTSYSLVED